MPERRPGRSTTKAPPPASRVRAGTRALLETSNFSANLAKSPPDLEFFLLKKKKKIRFSPWLLAQLHSFTCFQVLFLD